MRLSYHKYLVCGCYALVLLTYLTNVEAFMTVPQHHHLKVDLKVVHHDSHHCRQSSHSVNRKYFNSYNDEYLSDFSLDHSNNEVEASDASMSSLLLSSSFLSRRNVIQNIPCSIAKTAAAATLATTSLMTDSANAYVNEGENDTSASTSLAPVAPSSPPITHKVNFNVRISRADGTFYVRDDPPGTIPTSDNQVYTGTITLGLYGTYAPNHVSKFLQYAGSDGKSDRDGQGVGYSFDEVGALPSYSRSMFTTFLQSNGLLIGGSIPGLHLTTFSGSSALEYRGRITPATLWIDSFGSNNNSISNRPKLSHTKRGLVTHRNLDVLPNFGITTRDDTRELDATHTVFGEVLPTDSSNAFFRRIVDLPTYSNAAAVSGVGISTGARSGSGSATDGRAVEEVASSIYSFQKDIFRSAAKTFGDTRLDNIYEGKILRRVEVTSITVEAL